MWYLQDPEEFKQLYYEFNNGSFTPAEIDKINFQYGSAELTRASVLRGDNSPVNDSNVRGTDILWINPSTESEWIYRKLVSLINSINSSVYQYRLVGIEPIQYTVYNSDTKDFYDYHIDSHKERVVPGMNRKLSLVVQLSSPDEYEGGDLMILDTIKHEIAIPKQKGKTVIFDSRTIHRVTPVTSGTRKTLVAWVVGPSFV